MKKIGFLLIFSSMVWASDLYPFKQEKQAQAFHQLTRELRCVVCEGESLAGSSAPLAKRMREQIYQRLQQGAEIEQIRADLINQYGEFISLVPAYSKQNQWLWWGPMGFLLLAGVLVSWLVRRNG